MPQMSPMWWTTLMILFIMSMFISMHLLYFNYSKNVEGKKMKSMKNMNWTW